MRSIKLVAALVGLGLALVGDAFAQGMPVPGGTSLLGVASGMPVPPTAGVVPPVLGNGPGVPPPEQGRGPGVPPPPQYVPPSDLGWHVVAAVMAAECEGVADPDLAQARPKALLKALKVKLALGLPLTLWEKRVLNRQHDDPTITQMARKLLRSARVYQDLLDAKSRTAGVQPPMVSVPPDAR